LLLILFIALEGEMTSEHWFLVRGADKA